jgi:hypothetical protein
LASLRLRIRLSRSYSEDNRVQDSRQVAHRVEKSSLGARVSVVRSGLAVGPWLAACCGWRSDAGGRDPGNYGRSLGPEGDVPAPYGSRGCLLGPSATEPTGHSSTVWPFGMRRSPAVVPQGTNETPVIQAGGGSFLLVPGGKARTVGSFSKAIALRIVQPSFLRKTFPPLGYQMEART